MRARVAAGGSYLCLPFLYRPPSCCGAVAREMPGVTLGRGVLAPPAPARVWPGAPAAPNPQGGGLGSGGRLRARARPSPQTCPRPLPLPAHSGLGGLGGRGSGRAPGPAFPPDPRGDSQARRPPRPWLRRGAARFFHYGLENAAGEPGSDLAAAPEAGTPGGRGGHPSRHPRGGRRRRELGAAEQTRRRQGGSC
uniref:Cuticle collagen 39-like n=1 Tax=Callorhinus ursinus TaxID=34884 RepID=A0A3Q7PIW7_CALUR|nr:cuticle collagen 39-like [Callorhinus ursinus]